MRNFAMALLMAGVFCATGAQAIGLGFGLQGGVNFANVSAPSGIATSSVSGLMAGINLELRLSDDIAIQPELMYVQRGIRFTEASGAGATAHFDALELPVLFKVKFLEGIRPYVFAGPVAIVNISRGVDINSGGTTVSFNPRSTDFAADFGAGVEVGPFFANLRYSLGVAELNDNTASWSSRGFQMLVGIEF